MGFLQPNPQPVEPAEFLAKGNLERIQILAVDWVKNGFNVQKVVHLIYILKVGLVYAVGGVFLVSLTTPGIGSLADFGQWWNEPILYQKLIVWTLLVEVLGVGGAWGPLCGHFKPFTGGWRYFLRPGTIRLAPWPGKVPLTGGDRRTVPDVLLYVAILASLVWALLSPGVQTASLQAKLPHSAGILEPTLLLPILGLFVVTGLRDKVIFLAARAEQYLPALAFMAFLPFVDMIIALKLLIVVVWVGAGFSKFGEHFLNVIPPMVGNAPFVPAVAKRAHFRKPPTDLLPSGLSWFMAHIGGTLTEIVVPLTLLFATNKWVVLACIAYMVIFHTFIASTFPLAVPLEWNVIFGFAAVYLFWGFPAWDGYWLSDFSSPLLLAVIAALLVLFPALGNFRPDLVSFLPSMRQYAGNWASGLWAIAPGAEEKFNRVTRSAANTVDQLVAFGFERDLAEMASYRAVAWRSMHSQGRGLLSVLINHLDDDFDSYALREGEVACSTFTGWNFGDGHIHDERLIAAIQKQAQFEPGEFVVAFVESEPYGRKRGHQEYRVIDAALGVVQRGTWKVHDCVQEQPWLPNGPIPLNVTWRVASPA